MKNGCGCSTMCRFNYNVAEYTAMRDSYKELTRQEMDLLLMGELSTVTFDSSNTELVPATLRLQENVPSLVFDTGET